MRYRQALALLALGFLAVIAFRDAFVRSSIPINGAQAAAVWPDHPLAVIADRMTEIGKVAQLHHTVTDTLIYPVIWSARRSPLSIEPFLVAGVKAQTEGNEEAAGRLFHAAEQRDPRSVAPHLFLAAHYNKIGQTGLSLMELSQVVHIVPGGAAQIAPQIASWVRQAGDSAKVRVLVSRYPELRNETMRALATDARNYDLILSLRTSTSANDWQPAMIHALITAGQYDRAWALWAGTQNKSSTLNRRLLLYDPSFRLSVSPPFGWTLTSSPVGTAERADRAGLHVLSYRSEQFTVASQTLLLPPGTYMLGQGVKIVSGDPTRLRWQINCIDSGREVAAFGFSRGRAQSQFSVPSACRSQQIGLLVLAADNSETWEAIFEPVDLRSVN